MTARQPRIVMTHGYTDSNKGDAAIILGTVAALRKALPGASLFSQSMYSEAHAHFTGSARLLSQTGIPVTEGIFPSPYLDDDGSGFMHNLMSVLRLFYETVSLVVLWFLPRLAFIHPRKARALELLRQSDLVVARGGQYLHNESGRIRGLIFLSRMLISLAIPIWLKKPTVILGLSVGPVHGRLAHWMLGITLRSCSKIVVRESTSAEFLRQQGIEANVVVAPDMAFLTERTASTAYSLPTARYIGVTVLSWYFPGSANPRKAMTAYVDAVFETLVQCYRQHRLVPVVVMQVSAGHHGDFDGPVIDSLIARLHAAGVPAELISNDLTPAELVDVYGQCQVVIASRLHSFILAACAGVPSVAIAYQGYKTWGIMKLLGLQSHVYDIGTVNSNALLGSIATILPDRDSLRVDLLGKVEGFRQEIHSVVQTIIADTIRNGTHQAQ